MGDIGGEGRVSLSGGDGVTDWKGITSTGAAAWGGKERYHGVLTSPVR